MRTSVIAERVVPDKSASDPRSYRYVRLRNGLKCILIHDPDTDKAAVSVDMRVGKYEDPVSVPGLAHFCEHMLFLGTEKFPVENSYSKFLSAHGGRSNASTGNEHTNYYLDVLHPHLNDALDRVSQFFKTPLFTPSATEREINAVHNEHMKNKLKDTRKIFQVVKYLVNPRHPIFRFGSGNRATLETIPKEKNIDVRKHLLEFYDKYYTADRMSLAVLGRDTLDKLEEQVLEAFKGIRCKPAKALPDLKKDPKISEGLYAYEDDNVVSDAKDKIPERLIEAYNVHNLKKIIRVIPSKALRRIDILWPIPPLWEEYKSKPWSLLTMLLGDEGKGSILSFLKKKGWATGISSSRYILTRDLCLMKVSTSVTKAGMANYTSVLQAIFQYLKVIRRTTNDEWRRIFKEESSLRELRFRFLAKQAPYGYVHTVSRRGHRYSPKDILSGPFLVWELNTKLVKELTSKLHVENCNIILVDKDFEFNAKEVKTEPNYETKFTVSNIDSELLRMLGGGDDSKKGDWEFHIPCPNVYITTNIDIKKPMSEVAQMEAKKVNELTLKKRKDFNENDDLEFTFLGWDSIVPPSKICPFFNSTSCCWHKQDVRYKRPKAHLVMKIQQSYLGTSPQALLSLRLFRFLADDDLTEDLYPAAIAGLYYSVSLGRGGLVFRASGYNEKLPLIVEKVLKHFLVTFPQKLRSSNHSEILKKLRYAIDKRGRQLRNFKVKPAASIADYVRERCTESLCRWSNISMIRALEEYERMLKHDDETATKLITSNIIRHVERLRESLNGRDSSVTIFQHGNITKEEAGNMSRVIHQTLRQSAKRGEHQNEGKSGGSGSNSNSSVHTDGRISLAHLKFALPKRIAKLKLGHDYILRKAHPNEKEPNSCGYLYIELGENTVQRAALASLVAQIIREPAYDTLRTKEQLGYIVWRGIEVNCAVIAYYLQVVSSTHEASYLYKRMQAFLSSFALILKNMTEEEFEQSKRSKIGKLLKADLTLIDECNRHWREIGSERYQFARTQSVVKCMQQITKPDIISFYDRKFRPGSSERAALCVEIDPLSRIDEIKSVKEAKLEDNPTANSGRVILRDFNGMNPEDSEASMIKFKEQLEMHPDLRLINHQQAMPEKKSSL
eukprot:CAMPEP_0114496714 /NCGR_PEP_ID=MMETSP0109-20121206/5920_1 /TAXON_ID=29199 /ORGANISM="Chlorarachnion reptans, Strain CCCM449" /LENGTH=1123 /DNA_ID=CAMNT_0001674011 /DNA_START=36 /DNA_END=3407 /DNA_ORIENTATION=+